MAQAQLRAKHIPGSIAWTELCYQLKAAPLLLPTGAGVTVGAAGWVQQGKAGHWLQSHFPGMFAISVP